MTPFSRLAVLLIAAILSLPWAKAEWVWVEGEAAARSTANRHPWYTQVKRDQLSGGEFLSNFNPAKPAEATYDIKITAAGDYDLWVRANPVQARLSYSLAGSPMAEIDLTKDQQGSVNIAADGKPDLRFLAWVKAGKVPLKKGANSIAFRMDSKNSNHGMLDCFVLTSEPFQPRGTVKPDQLAQAAKQDAEANKGWFAFDPKPDTFGPTSGFDLRQLNEAAAGDGGFIAARDGRFVHSKTVEPVRFWAVNGPPASLKDPGELRQCGRMLAKYGVNMVRLHGGMFGKDGEADPAKVVHAIRVVDAMKASGIYSHFSIYFPLWLTPKAGTPWLEGYDGTKHPFAALYFNRDFQKQYQSWWKALLLTPDKATGKRLVDEAAVAGLEIINEDSYFFWTFDAKNIPEAQLRIVEGQFAQWLVKKYGSLAAAQAKWGKTATARDAFPEGRVGLRPLWNMFTQKTLRDQDTAAFLLDSQRTFYEETRDFLRGLGFKGVITCSNWHTASAEVFGPMERYSYLAGDFVDRHGYFGCDLKGESSAWSIRDGHTYADRSALRFDPEEPGKPRVFHHPAMDIHYGDRPSMISETTWCRPNRYRSEAPLFYAAYGALQDTDAIVHFALDSAAWSVKPGFFMQPWTLATPAMLGQFPAAAMVYRRELVAPGALLAEISLDVADLRALRGTPMPEGAAFDELRLKDVPPGQAGQVLGPIDPLIHFAGRTRTHFIAGSAPSKLADLSRWVNRKGQTVSSTTWELSLNYGQGVLTINAPSAQGISGNLRAAGPTTLKDVTITSGLETGHIIAVSLDGQPLAKSQKILVQAMSEEKATGFTTEPAPGGRLKITSIGRDPWLVRNIEGSVRFARPDAANLKVTTLDQSGYPARQAGTAADLKLDPHTVYYLVTP